MIVKTAKGAVKLLKATIVAEEAEDEAMERDAAAVVVVVANQPKAVKARELLERTMAAETTIKAKRTELPRLRTVKLLKEKFVEVEVDAVDVVAPEDLASPGIQTHHPVSRIRNVLKLHVAAKEEGPARSAHPNKLAMRAMAKTAKTQHQVMIKNLNSKSFPARIHKVLTEVVNKPEEAMMASNVLKQETERDLPAVITRETLQMTTATSKTASKDPQEPTDQDTTKTTGPLVNKDVAETVSSEKIAATVVETEDTAIAVAKEAVVATAIAVVKATAVATEIAVAKATVDAITIAVAKAATLGVTPMALLAAITEAAAEVDQEAAATITLMPNDFDPKTWLESNNI